MSISDKTIEAIQAGVTQRSVLIDGVLYSTHKLHDLRKPEPSTTPLNVAGLTGIVEYIQTHEIELRDPAPESDLISAPGPYVIHVADFNSVELISHQYGYFEQRDTFAKAVAPWPPGLKFGVWVESEIFVIQLMSLFGVTDARDQMIRLLASITSEAVATHDDDSVVQTVTIKRGVRLKETGVIPNPVLLQPFRTFREIEQPESLFVFRARTGDTMPECALYEADGTSWKLTAVDRIQAWFIAALKDEIEEGKVQIIG